MQTFPLKTWVPVWCIVAHYTNQPCDLIPESGTAIEVVSQSQACILCFKPASAFTVGSSFLQSPILECTWSEPASGPEFLAPLNPMGTYGGCIDGEFTGVPHLQENAPPQDPTVGLCLGYQGEPIGVGVFSWASYPCSPRIIRARAPGTVATQSNLMRLIDLFTRTGRLPSCHRNHPVVPLQDPSNRFESRLAPFDG